MDTLDRRDANEISEKRKYVFYITRFLAFVILGASTLAIAQQMKAEQSSMLLYCIYPVTVMFWRWAASFATLVCRRLGLSLDGTTIERLKRVEVETFATHPITEPFRVERDCKFFLPVGVTILCVVCIGPPLFGMPHTFKHFGHTIFHVLSFSLLAATAILSWLNIRKPLVKVNARGIAYCDSLGIISKFVAWRKLGSCDVISERDVFGEMIRQSLILRNTRGKKIITVWMQADSKGTVMQNTEHVANLIKQELTGV